VNSDDVVAQLRPASDVDIVLSVDRHRHLAAIHCHASQSVDNPVLWRRLELQGDAEWLVWLQTDRTKEEELAAPLPHAAAG
jgi:LmbE family N-acetylglucosaminyl deacetylase